MICQMKAAVTTLLWKAGWTTRLYSWGLVLSLSFLVGQLLGYGIAGLSAIVTASNKPSISSVKDLPKWKQGSVSTDIELNTSNDWRKGNKL